MTDKIVKLSKDAFVSMGMCEETKHPFGITIDKIAPHQFSMIWSFKIDADKAHREGYDATSVDGGLTADPDYPGCPYCGSKKYYSCSRCGTLVCYHDTEAVTCPKCGAHGIITTVDSINIKGGGY